MCEAGFICPNADGTGIQACQPGTYSLAGWFPLSYIVIDYSQHQFMLLTAAVKQVSQYKAPSLC